MDPLTMALHDAAHAACTRYPAEHERIQRGLAIALAGQVTLVDDPDATPPVKLAHVRSASRPDVTYHVNGTCACYDFAKAPDGHCKHRFAAALLRKAHALLQQRWYATWYTIDGIGHPGTAEYRDGHWVFRAEPTPQWQGSTAFAPVRLQNLALGGHMGVAEAQAHQDGAYWHKVAYSPYPVTGAVFTPRARRQGV